MVGREAVNLHRAAPLSDVFGGGGGGGGGSVTVARQGSGGRRALEPEPQPLGSDVTPDLTNESARKLRIRKGRNANHRERRVLIRECLPTNLTQCNHDVG